ncbi:LuxR C-terminal-related transcriptional regulator [Kitasatospora aureofaciens]|uniref:LuxR C-terminal-related transcriptional regulator n=1 Tax=Kitasatospora aureofaciens TaxID=1894 RepID=UPI000A7932F2|nr:LuxR C-terminal-related transcriptional regulator [Kitasatospora aureofaciens]HJD83000.1 LuxR C-terminal-related transcriptional regulator [Kitasatospora aureofaciens]
MGGLGGAGGFDADQFIGSLERVAAGGAAMDPAVIAKPLSASPPERGLSQLTEREYEVLGLMAEGLSNQAVGRRLFPSDSAVGKYTTSMFGKLRIADDDDTNRRVRAVLSYLDQP